MSQIFIPFPCNWTFSSGALLARFHKLLNLPIHLMFTGGTYIAKFSKTQILSMIKKQICRISQVNSI